MQYDTLNLFYYCNIELYTAIKKIMHIIVQKHCGNLC